MRAYILVSVFVLSFAAVACVQVSTSKGGGGSNASWRCAKTLGRCQCQQSPIGGNVEIVDHCDRSSVPVDGGTPVECCKQWIILDGHKQTAFLCSCYQPDGQHYCDTKSGDELVDRCP
jgi:hypothetical protein